MIRKITFIILLLSIITSIKAQSLALIREAKRFGYINTQGEEVIAPQFKHAKSFSEGYAAAFKDGKWGFINAEGKWVIEPQYDNVKSFNSGLALVFKNRVWHYINKKGEVLEIKTATDKFYDFNNGVAFIRTGKLVGLINPKGDVIVKPKYEIIRRFENGYAKILKNKKWGIINVKGEELVKPLYDKIGDYNKNKVTWGVLNKKTGLIKEGNFKALEGVSRIWDFTNKSEFTYAESKGKVGFINVDGEWVIAPQFKKAKAFNNGLAPVYNKGKWGYINTKGELTINCQFADAEVFSENGLAPVKKLKWGFINKNGAMVTQFKYEITPGLSFKKHIKGFINGLARVKINEKWGFIKEDGSLLGDKTYQNAELFVIIKE
ncbi:WG repeat-containing protein [Tenacibaculum caenipelagi]|uniref:WG repeat protein n=1 Tax=Tenacibaculum caenipelagi TaxID=1325435 RepID=A0A4R6TI53_9FLAO|nr:WG repeat-containing protein [Tenacibaculum caenipelagi]TDQ28849.1 WG repeat protein [Tenacibaculum caenipelagi]